jgi:hypothetical protein
MFVIYLSWLMFKSIYSNQLHFLSLLIKYFIETWKEQHLRRSDLILKYNYFYMRNLLVIISR